MIKKVNHLSIPLKEKENSIEDTIVSKQWIVQFTDILDVIVTGYSSNDIERSILKSESTSFNLLVVVNSFISYILNIISRIERTYQHIKCVVLPFMHTRPLELNVTWSLLLKFVLVSDQWLQFSTRKFHSSQIAKAWEESLYKKS